MRTLLILSVFLISMAEAAFGATQYEKHRCTAELTVPYESSNDFIKIQQTTYVGISAPKFLPNTTGASKGSARRAIQVDCEEKNAARFQPQARVHRHINGRINYHCREALKNAVYDDCVKLP